MSYEEKFNAAVNVIRSLPKNGKCINFTYLSVYLYMNTGYNPHI